MVLKHFGVSLKAFQGKNLLIDGDLREACLIVKNGVISDILEKLPENFEGTVVHCGDNVLMPGLVDTHVHINEPGRTDWEGFETATKAAVAHDDGLDALLGTRQRSGRLSRRVTADGMLSEHARTAWQAQTAPRFLRWLRRNPELALCL